MSGPAPPRSDAFVPGRCPGRHAGWIPRYFSGLRRRRSRARVIRPETVKPRAQAKTPTPMAGATPMPPMREKPTPAAVKPTVSGATAARTTTAPAGPVVAGTLLGPPFKHCSGGRRRTYARVPLPHRSAEVVGGQLAQVGVGRVGQPDDPVGLAADGGFEEVAGEAPVAEALAAGLGDQAGVEPVPGFGGQLVELSRPRPSKMATNSSVV